MANSEFSDRVIQVGMFKPSMLEVSEFVTLLTNTRAYSIPKDDINRVNANGYVYFSFPINGHDVDELIFDIANSSHRTSEYKFRPSGMEAI